MRESVNVFPDVVGECGGVLLEGVGFSHLDEFPGNGGHKVDPGTIGVFGESVTADSNGDVVFHCLNLQIVLLFCWGTNQRVNCLIV